MGGVTDETVVGIRGEETDEALVVVVVGRHRRDSR